MHSVSSNYDYIINMGCAGHSIFFKCSSTSLLTGGAFYKNWNNLQEYLIQLFEIRKDHFRHVKVPLLKGLAMGRWKRSTEKNLNYREEKNLKTIILLFFKGYL